MPLKNPRSAIAPALLLLTVLCVGCASVTPPLVLPAQVPPLPQAARQPPLPPICVPTCSDGLARLLDSLLPPPTSAVPPAAPASAATRQ